MIMENGYEKQITKSKKRTYMGQYKYHKWGTLCDGRIIYDEMVIDQDNSEHSIRIRHIKDKQDRYTDQYGIKCREKILDNMEKHYSKDGTSYYYTILKKEDVIEYFGKEAVEEI